MQLRKPLDVGNHTATNSTHSGTPLPETAEERQDRKSELAGYTRDVRTRKTHGAHDLLRCTEIIPELDLQHKKHNLWTNLQ